MFLDFCHAFLIQTGSKKEKELINVIFSSKLKEKFEKKQSIECLSCDGTNSFPFIWRLYLNSVKPYRKNKWGYSSLSEESNELIYVL